MGKKTTDITEKLSEDFADVREWCRKHTKELAMHRGKRVAWHPLFGIIFADVDLEQLMFLSGTLKKKIRRDVSYLNVDLMLEAVGWVETPVPPKPTPARKRKDDVSKIWTQPAPKPGEPRPTVTFDAEQAVLEKNDPPPPLNPPIDPFDNDILIDGTPHPSTNPFPSPDKQPPYMPRRNPLEGSVRLDGVSNPGARGSWSGRGLRFD